MSSNYKLSTDAQAVHTGMFAIAPSIISSDAPLGIPPGISMRISRRIRTEDSPGIPTGSSLMIFFSRFHIWEFPQKLHPELIYESLRHFPGIHSRISTITSPEILSRSLS